MGIYEFLIGNKEILKIFFTLAVGLICFAIVLRTDRLFRLSFHQGIRYFRNAFLFYGMAFIIRYIFGIFYIFSKNSIIYSLIMRVVFEFFLIMAGFFLLYSLLWRNLDDTLPSTSSLFNTRINLFYVFALILSVLDCIWNTYTFMFFSQIITFSFASGICFVKYGISEKQKPFLKLYFIVMVLNLSAWTLNFLVASFFGWNTVGIMGVYFLNLIIFFLFLYNVLSIIKNKEK